MSVTLKSSDSSINKKFRVARRTIQHNRHESVSFTLDHNLDIERGGLYNLHQLVIMVRETETEAGYGDKDDLISIISLNNPNGTPTDVVTYIDNEGDTHTGYIVGNTSEKIIAVQVVGTEAWFYMELQFMEII